VTTDTERTPTWISVDDQLPAIEVLVLGWTSEGALGVFSRASLDEDGWSWERQADFADLANPAGLECDDEYEVTHWMPIPEGPRV
jgi:Protein of unknown function (DUF551)